VSFRDIYGARTDIIPRNPRHCAPKVEQEHAPSASSRTARRPDQGEVEHPRFLHRRHMRAGVSVIDVRTQLVDQAVEVEMRIMRL
jgi:hypothetical protein